MVLTMVAREQLKRALTMLNVRLSSEYFTKSYHEMTKIKGVYYRLLSMLIFNMVPCLSETC